MIDDREITQNAAELQALMLARQEIEGLRRWYGVATDLLGKVDDASAQQHGLGIYHRIFTPDADIQVSGTDKPLHGVGPDAWANVARNALKDYQATQHLIGSQVVTFERVDFNPRSATLDSGYAHMSSYLQAWHAWPDRRLRLVLGSYIDGVTFTPGVGWQISSMDLQHVSGEHRTLGPAS